MTDLIPNTPLAAKIAAAMTAAKYPLAVGSDVTNTIYVEGMNVDGTPNAFRPNAFDCVRLVLRVPPEGAPAILGIWDAITHAGIYWEVHRMNPAGAFHIALGPQTCWTMGHYHNMIALVQSAPITGTRDSDNQIKRVGPTVCGDFGVHHHQGYNYPHDDAGKSSAGCQVGRSKEGHNEFIAILKTDARFKKTPGTLWTSTVLTAQQVLSP